MHLFKSREENLVHYVTCVTFDRIPLFQRNKICSLFIDALEATRTKDPFKLIGYVIMPDHIHLLANPIALNISKVVGRLKGRAATKILKDLRMLGCWDVLDELKLLQPLKSGQTHAVWLKDFSSIDIWSHKFIRQKLHYIHMNPVRAGLVEKAIDSAIIRPNGFGPAIMPIFLTSWVAFRSKLTGGGCGLKRNSRQQRRTSPPSKRRAISF